MLVMRYTIVDAVGTVSFVAPWNTLKALVAGCSRKPAPQSLSELLEAASKYTAGLQEYVLDGLAVFDEHNSSGIESEKVELSPELEKELDTILAKADLTANLPNPETAYYYGEEQAVPPPEEEEISFEQLRQKQRQLRGVAPARHMVMRVTDPATRQESLEPVKIGLVIFNLPAKRIIQVQNSYGVLKRSDRGRYFKDGQPTDRLYFYRLPTDWSLLP